MRKAVVSFVCVVMCLFMFAGCGGKTIEDKVSQSQLNKMCEEFKSDPSFSQTFKDIKIELDGNHVTYKYYFKMEMDDSQIDQMKTQLAGSGLQGQIDGLKDSFKKDCGIRPDMISFSYYDGNNTLITTIEE